MNWKVSIEINNEKITFVTQHGQANDALTAEQKQDIMYVLSQIMELDWGHND